jgi:hypothetical protein
MSVSLISVVLPVGNPTLSMVARLQDYLTSLGGLEATFELLPVIDRTHLDKPPESFRALSECEPRIRTLFVDAAGWGHSVQRGLSEARGELLCYTNLARTSSADLRTVLNHGLKHPNSVIKANRRIKDGFIPRLGSLLYVVECRWLFDLAYWDINGTPKVFPRELRKLLALKSEDDLVDLEFDVVCRREGYPVLEVPLSTIDRRTDFDHIGLMSALHLYAGAFRLWRQMRVQ